MTPELTEAVYQFIQFAKAALRREGHEDTAVSMASVFKAHPNQVGLAVRRTGKIGYDLLIKWAAALREAGLGDAVLTVNSDGPSFRFKFPDKTTFIAPRESPHSPKEAFENLVLEGQELRRVFEQRTAGMRTPRDGDPSV